jgi:hypothetical protein
MRTWPRVAWAALGFWFFGVVAAHVVNEVEPQIIGNRIIGSGISGGSDEPTIMRLMFMGSWKYIEVPSPAPQINKFSSVLSINNVLGRNSGARRSWSLAGRRLIVGGQQTAIPGLKRVVPVIEVRWERGISDLTFCIKGELLSWGAYQEFCVRGHSEPGEGLGETHDHTERTD